MSTTATTIWSKTKDDGTRVEVAYDGSDCTVTFAGKQIAKGWPARPTADQIRKMRLPEDVTATILPASFRGADGEAIHAAFGQIRADKAADKAAKLAELFPGLADLEHASRVWGAYDRQVKADIERGEVFTAAKPAVDLEALIARYPTAWLYLRVVSSLEVSESHDRIDRLERAKAILMDGGSADEARKLVPHLS